MSEIVAGKMRRAQIVSRRHFLATTGVAVAAVWLTPPELFADEGSPVIAFRNAAATAKITITKPRGSIRSRRRCCLNMSFPPRLTNNQAIESEMQGLELAVTTRRNIHLKQT